MTRRAGLLGLVALSGAAALSWELFWQHFASLALGVSALGTAITLAVTKASMTAGSLAMASWLRARRVEAPLRLDDEDSPLWSAFAIEVVPTVIAFDGGRLRRRLDGRLGIGLDEAGLRRLLDEVAG